MFRRKQKQIINYEPVVPNGLIAITENGSFLVKNNKRYKFVSDRAKNSWNLREVLTSENAMKDFRIAGTIGFRDGTLIKDISDHKLYIISDYKKMHVVDPDTIVKLGMRTWDAMEVSKKEASMHQYGGQLGAK